MILIKLLSSLILVFSTCSAIKSSATIKHYDIFIPTEVTWNARIYLVKAGSGFVKTVGEKLGISTFDVNGAREVYRIPGVDPSKEIAIRHSRHRYLRAVIKN
jgi:hypothetical protein